MQKRGGVEQVVRLKLWREVKDELGLTKTVTNAGFLLKNKYLEYFKGIEETLNTFLTVNQGSRAAPVRPDIALLDPVPYSALSDVIEAVKVVLDAADDHFIGQDKSDRGPRPDPMLSLLSCQNETSYRYLARAWPHPVFTIGRHGVPPNLELSSNVKTLRFEGPPSGWGVESWPIGEGIVEICCEAWSQPPAVIEAGYARYPNLARIVVQCNRWTLEDVLTMPRACPMKLMLIRMHDIPTFGSDAPGPFRLDPVDASRLALHRAVHTALAPDHSVPTVPSGVPGPSPMGVLAETAMLRMMSQLPELHEAFYHFRERYTPFLLTNSTGMQCHLTLLMVENAVINIRVLLRTFPSIKGLHLRGCVIIGLTSVHMVSWLSSFRVDDCYEAVEGMAPTAAGLPVVPADVAVYNRPPAWSTGRLGYGFDTFEDS